MKAQVHVTPHHTKERSNFRMTLQGVVKDSAAEQSQAQGGRVILALLASICLFFLTAGHTEGAGTSTAVLPAICLSYGVALAEATYELQVAYACIKGWKKQHILFSWFTQQGLLPVC